MTGLTHFDDDGRPHMVDVGAKDTTARKAVASGTVTMSAATLDLLKEGSTKGDVIGVATLAGIMGAKRTADLIPLCHPLPLNTVDVVITPDDELPGVRIIGTTKTNSKTGVEMEALTAVSTAALTVYDMLKAVDRSMVLGSIQLEAKEGGKSGTWTRPNDTSATV
ncbi:MAG: cyclic pyranopterin monophosphate synthase MoaC [Pseudomonadota bacterium]